MHREDSVLQRELLGGAAEPRGRDEDGKAGPEVHLGAQQIAQFAARDRLSGRTLRRRVVSVLVSVARGRQPSTRL